MDTRPRQRFVDRNLKTQGIWSGRHPRRATDSAPLGRTGTCHLHFHVLLIVSTKYFELGAPLYIGQAEWRVMRSRAFAWAADGSSESPGIPGEFAKSVTKPGADLKLDGDAPGDAILIGSKQCTARSPAGG